MEVKLPSNFYTVAWEVTFSWRRTLLSAFEQFSSEFSQTASWTQVVGSLGSNERIRFASRRRIAGQGHDSQVDVRCRFGGGRSEEYLTSFSFLRCSRSALWLRSLAPSCLNFSASLSRNSCYMAIGLSQPH